MSTILHDYVTICQQTIDYKLNFLLVIMVVAVDGSLLTEKKLHLLNLTY